MPRPRLDADQQAALLDATVRVIAQRGTERTRLADVAQAVGRSTGTLQHYFGSRDELFAAAFRRLNDVAAAEARVAAQKLPDAWARLTSILDAILRAEWRDEWKAWLEFWAAAARDPALRELTGDVYATWRALLLEAIEDGIEARTFAPTRSPESIASTLLAMLDGAALHTLLAINDLNPEAANAMVRDVAAIQVGMVSSPRARRIARPPQR